MAETVHKFQLTAITNESTILWTLEREDAAISFVGENLYAVMRDFSNFYGLQKSFIPWVDFSKN